MKIIVIGGNAAGPAAAAKAKRVNPGASVVMYEAGNFISTGTCEIPFLFSGEIEDYKRLIYFDENSFPRKKGVKVFLHHKVENINRKSKTITVTDISSGKVIEDGYDKLILSTGGKAKKIPALEKFQNVFTIKSIQDYLNIKKYIDANDVNSVSIIGSGYIGLEIADALAKRLKKVSVFDIFEEPFPTAEIEIRKIIKQSLIDSGVEFYGKAANNEYVSENNRITAIKLNKKLINTDLVITAIGVEPNVSLGKSAGLEIGQFGGYTVDNRRKTSDCNIFAAGDNSEVVEFITKKKAFIPLASFAHKFGHIAGANAAGGNLFAAPAIKNIAVQFFNNSYSAAGLSLAEAENHFYNVKSSSAVISNLVRVMPGSRKVFGKIIYNADNRNILGGAFIGGREAAGYADFVSLCIKNNIKIDSLNEVDFNYTPPLSPFVNLFSILAKSAE